MGRTIRRSFGDTDPFIFILKEKYPGEDITRPVSLVDKEVRITIVDSNIEGQLVADGYVFTNEVERDAYFTTHADDLIDGLVIDIFTYDAVNGPQHLYQRWRSGQWNLDFWLVVDDKLCTVMDAGKGYVSYSFTKEEGKRPGMFHVFYRVISNAGTPSETSAKYPKGESLWIHIMDIFTE